MSAPFIFTPRGYQIDGINSIQAAWSVGFKNVLYVLPTGGGKTVTFSMIVNQFNGPAVIIAHRREILSQISMTLARSNVRHSIIGPEKTTRLFISQQRELLGKTLIHPNSIVYVASVDTLRARESEFRKWGQSIRLWVQDECHHVLDDNKWGRATYLFPHAVGLGVTATPVRGDRRSLKRGSGGLFDVLIQGPQLRDLITSNYLTDYRIFAPESGINRDSLVVGSSGEYTQKSLTASLRGSRIIGDLVESYLTFAPGETGVCFLPDIKSAEEVANQFRAKGIPSASLNANSKSDYRADCIRALRNGELKMVPNVDLFSEGFDLPGIQVVSVGAATASYSRYSQRIGRMLRTMEGKTVGKYLDHVGDVSFHGLPDQHINWSLDSGREKTEDEPPVKTCKNLSCLRVWSGYKRVCPFCGYAPKGQKRNAPEYVDGVLTELDTPTLNRLRAEILRVDSSVETVTQPLKRAGASPAAIAGLAANHRKRQTAQRELREVMALWGGYAKACGLDDAERQSKFYMDFKVDVLAAQALGSPAAHDLKTKISESLTKFNI